MADTCGGCRQHLVLLATQMRHMSPQHMRILPNTWPLPNEVEKYVFLVLPCFAGNFRKVPRYLPDCIYLSFNRESNCNKYGSGST